MNRYMYDMHVVKYMYLYGHTQIILAKCIYEPSQNHGCVKEFRICLHLAYLLLKKAVTSVYLW